VTLADRLAAVLLEQGPMPACDLAPAVKKQKTEVLAVLYGHPDRFAHNGLKARASRWDVRPADPNGTVNPTYRLDELALRWGFDERLVHTLVLGEGGFLERGFMESVDGNGRVRVTELGRIASHVLNGAAP
jgi:hypothetical protein